MKFFESCKCYRNAQRLNGGVEILSKSISIFNPFVQIPSKVAQCVISTQSIFKSDTSVFEKSISATQAFLCLLQMGLLVSILFLSVDCGISATILCNAVIVTDLIYNGLLLSGWATAEIWKHNDEHWNSEMV